MPQLIINRPVTSLKHVDDELKYTLTSNNLKVRDHDTPSDYIMYWVIDKPAVGQLLKGGQPANMWTQGNTLTVHLASDILKTVQLARNFNKSQFFLVESTCLY